MGGGRAGLPRVTGLRRGVRTGRPLGLSRTAGTPRRATAPSAIGLSVGLPSWPTAELPPCPRPTAPPVLGSATSRLQVIILGLGVSFVGHSNRDSFQKMGGQGRVLRGRLRVRSTGREAGGMGSEAHVAPGGKGSPSPQPRVRTESAHLSRGHPRAGTGRPSPGTCILFTIMKKLSYL